MGGGAVYWEAGMVLSTLVSASFSFDVWHFALLDAELESKESLFVGRTVSSQALSYPFLQNPSANIWPLANFKAPLDERLCVKYCVYTSWAQQIGVA